MLNNTSPLQTSCSLALHSFSETLYQNSQFNIQLWRTVLDRLIDDIDKPKIGLEIISPFGFEVMEDHRFLNSTLRRFYCYIGILTKYFEFAEQIAYKFDQNLTSLLANKFPAFHDEIVLKAIQENFIKLRPPDYQCTPHNKLIDIQCRSMTTSLLDDYADYLICCLAALYFGKDEPKFFNDNLRFRNRTYQLYVMIEKIYGH